MPVFTCNNCNNKLKPDAVQKHFSKVCKEEKCLNCTNCLKYFRDDNYLSHTECNDKKGINVAALKKEADAKLKQWKDMISSIITEEPNLSIEQKNYLDVFAKHKKMSKKRQNVITFTVKPLLGEEFDISTFAKTWKIVEKYKPKGTPQKKRKLDNVDVESSEPAKKKKKNNVQENGMKQKNKKKHLEKTEDKNEKTEILKQKKVVPLKNSKKKVMKASLKKMGKSEGTDEVKKFNKALKKKKNVTVDS